MLLIFAKLHIFFDILQRKRLKFSKNAKQSDELAAFPLICSNFTKIITALGITKLKNEFFILFFARLALILDKLGCGSEEQIKKQVFYFVFHSPCTNFVKQSKITMTMEKKQLKLCSLGMQDLTIYQTLTI